MFFDAESRFIELGISVLPNNIHCEETGVERLQFWLLMGSK